MATLSYEHEVRHDDRLFAFNIPALRLPVCQACGEKVFTEMIDEQFNAALRSHRRLLSPSEILAGIERVGMTREQVADRLGIAEATLGYWLDETQVQSKAMDNLLRVFFEFPQVRDALVEEPRESIVDFNESGPGREDGRRARQVIEA